MNPINSALALSINSAFTPQLDLTETRSQTTETTAVLRLKQTPPELAEDENYKEFRSIIRATADSVRKKAFGHNRAVTKREILRLLDEFFVLELDDITDETRNQRKRNQSRH